MLGVDFSLPLVEIARTDHQPANVTYAHLDVLALHQLPVEQRDLFDKALMVGSLQYMRRNQLLSVPSWGASSR